MTKICQTEPLKNIAQLIFDPEKRDRNAETEDHFWERFVRNYSVTVCHPIGTCQMGPADDRMSVVTPDIRLKGVRGLRVIDASIISKLVSGKTSIPTVARSDPKQRLDRFFPLCDFSFRSKTSEKIDNS